MFNISETDTKLISTEVDGMGS